MWPKSEFTPCRGVWGGGGGGGGGKRGGDNAEK